ncbi:MAG: choice-of-anchor L domain-containing protein [Bacteroidota bacterium]
MIRNVPFYMLFFVLFGTSLFSQDVIDYDRFKFIEVDRYEKIVSPNRVHLACNYGQDTILNPKDTIKLRNKRILKVQYFYSGYPKNRQFTGLHKRRIRKLSKLVPQLVSQQASITWELVRQAKVNGQEEAEGLFHGFALFISEKGDLSKLSEELRAKLDTVKTQVALTQANTEEEIINAFQGEGVTIFNVVTNDTSKLAPRFVPFEEEEGVMGLKKGMMLTTGIAENAIGPNDNKRKSFTNSKERIDDPDLKSLYKGEKKLFDLCVIEFDLKADADTLSFNYVFASEEYPEYIDYHDVFGFFISGPNIGGAKRMRLTPKALEAMKEQEQLPEKLMVEMEKIAQKPFVNKGGFLNFLKKQIGGKMFTKYRPIMEKYVEDFKNIARIPGSDELVSVGTINHKKNKHLYIANTAEGNLRLFKAWQYDGFSKVLEAKVKIVPNETYHLKLAIADQKDARYDSAIFIEGQSLRSKQVVNKLEGELDDKN